MKVVVASLIALVLGAVPGAASAAVEPTEDRAAAEAAISDYNSALTSGDAEAFKSALAGQIFMFNGAAANDPTKWEAHMFVPRERLDQWAENFVIGAGPHANTYRVVSVNIRANAAVITTEDTGSNRFRAWTNERVTWLLGRGADGWKVAGFFIKEVKNPN